MRISTRGRYALRAMVDLARHADEGPVLRRDIAERQNISADYVAQLFRELRAAELVNGVKGPGGGYTLARDPAAISAGDIVRAVEGSIAVTECVAPGGDFDCCRIGECATREVWQQVSQAVEEVLNEITLADLRDKAQLQSTELVTQNKEAK
jgi:Rrf2 family cysteine metabolism transcriptional repressor